MNLRVLAIATPLSCWVPGLAAGEPAQLATATAPSYDVVANCLMREMTPHLAAVPVVRPPPTNRAEVHLYPHGSGRFGTPVASFFLSQVDGAPTAITFEERPDQRGRHTAAAEAAARRCSR